MKNKEEYDATYKFGNATVHVVAPPPKSEEEIRKILREYHQAGWDIWEEYVAKHGLDTG